MNESEFLTPTCPGELVSMPSGGVAFLPRDLPPKWEWNNRLVNALASARAAVDKLDVAISSDVNPYLIAYPLMVREAFYSSRMEGTYTTPQELTLFEVRGAGSSSNDTREVANYAHAMRTGLEMVHSGSRIGQGLIKTLHHVLLDGVRGEEKSPGQYRTKQNFIGRGPRIDDARFVPPPPVHVPAAMDQLEAYIGAVDTHDEGLPLLVDLALIHYQFETIHPFNDGNGRVGRLLIPLILIERKRISEPLLYVSAYLDRNKQEYIDRMYRVSTRSEWTEWILFFLRALEESAKESLEKARALIELRKRYRDAVTAPRSSALMCDLVDSLFRDPWLTFKKAQQVLEVSQPQAAHHVRKLEKLGIVTEQTGKSRNLIFAPEEIWKVVVG